MKQLLVFVGVLMLISSAVSLENNINDKKIKKHEKRGALNYGFGLSQEQNNQYQIYGTPQQEQLQINEQNIPDHSNENNHHNVFQQDHQNHILLPQNIPHVHPVPIAPVHNVPFALPQPVPIVPPVVPQTIIKPVGIPYPVHVEKIVDRPYPVAVPVPKYIEKIVHVDRPIAVPIEKHIHVPVDRPYAVPVPVYKDRPIHVPQPYPVHVAVPVLKPYPVPVAVQYKPLPHYYHHHQNQHQQQQQQQLQGW